MQYSLVQERSPKGVAQVRNVTRAWFQNGMFSELLNKIDLKNELSLLRLAAETYVFDPKFHVGVGFIFKKSYANFTVRRRDKLYGDLK